MPSSNFKFLSHGVRAAAQNWILSAEAEGDLPDTGAGFSAAANFPLPTAPIAAAAPKVPRKVLRVVAMMSPFQAKKESAGSLSHSREKRKTFIICSQLLKSSPCQAQMCLPLCYHSRQFSRPVAGRGKQWKR